MITIKSRFTALLLGIFLSLPVFSQTFNDREAVNQSAQWFALVSNIKMSTRTTLLAEGQFRYVNGFDAQQYQFRTGLDFSITKGLSLMPLGYVYTWNPIYGKQPAKYVNNEHRIYQQILYKHSISRFKLSHRLRSEQRFIQKHETTNGEVINKGYDLYLNRLRYRLMINVPINNPNMDPKTLYASFYHELFLDWGGAIARHKPDQNRVFAGVGYQFDKKLSVQGGFFYQMTIKLNGVQQENNVGFQVQATYNIDLTKD